VRLFAGPGLRERQRRLESAAREAEVAARQARQRRGGLRDPPGRPHERQELG